MTGASREARMSDAFVTLADTLTEEFDIIDFFHSLVEKCTDLLDTQTAGLMLLNEAGKMEVVASTSSQTQIIETMQLNGWIGPCVQCFTTGLPVTIGDIDKSGDNWPEFRRSARELGFKSVHCTPMRLHGEVIGALNMFSVQVGELGALDIALAQALADVATIGLVQERNIRRSGVVAEQLQHALTSRVLIEQAKGVVSQSASVPMDQAFSVIRNYARSHNLAVTEVAAALVSRSITYAALISPPTEH